MKNLNLEQKNQLDGIGASGHPAEDGRDVEGVATLGDGHVAIAKHFPDENGEDGRRELVSHSVRGFQSEFQRFIVVQEWAGRLLGHIQPHRGYTRSYIAQRGKHIKDYVPINHKSYWGWFWRTGDIYSSCFIMAKKQRDFWHEMYTVNQTPDYYYV